MFKEKIAIIRIFPKVTEGTGGMEHHIRQLTEEQRLQGHNVILLYNDGLRKNALDIVIKPTKKFYGYSRPQFIGIMKFYFFTINKIFSDKLTCEIIHLHGDWSSFLFAPIIKKLTNARKVYFTMHAAINASFSHQILLPICLRFSDKNFTTGHECYQLIKKYNQTIFQPSGVDDVFFKFSRVSFNKLHRIICVSHFRPKKNISLILKIAEKLPYIQFSIVGDGIEKDILTAQARNLKLDNVAFMGKQSKEEIAKHLSQHDLFLLTSLEEGTPTVIMEAMTCGLPIVCSNAGGTESIIEDGENGYVIKNDYNDVNAYVSAILKIASNEILLSEMSRKNIEKSKEFHWEIVANKISNEMFN